jgi:hypothetical protein
MRWSALLPMLSERVGKDQVDHCMAFLRRDLGATRLVHTTRPQKDHLGSEMGRSGFSRAMKRVSQGDGIGDGYRMHAVINHTKCNARDIPNLHMESRGSQGWQACEQELHVAVSVGLATIEVVSLDVAFNCVSCGQRNITFLMCEPQRAWTARFPRKRCFWHSSSESFLSAVSLLSVIHFLVFHFRDASSGWHSQLHRTSVSALRGH